MKAIKRTLIIALSGVAMISLAQADHHEGRGEGHADSSGKVMTSQKLDAKTFVQKAALGNKVEMEMAQLGIQHGQNLQLKEFSSKLHQDHLQASNRLATVAKDLGVTLEKDLKPKHKEKMDGLKNASNFDREFTLALLKDHARDVALYEKAESQIDNQQVKQYARQTLPTLRQHLTQAKALAQTVGVDQATIASTISQATEQPMGGSEDTEETVEDERGRSNVDEGADSKVHQGAGAEQLTEGTR
jgi:predicted outer membrane protein